MARNHSTNVEISIFKKDYQSIEEFFNDYLEAL